MPRTLGPNDLVASYFTLCGAGVGQPARHSFESRVAAAAAAGFAGIGMTGPDYERERATTSDADLRAMADHHGIVVSEVEFLGGWTAVGGADPQDARAAEQTLLHMADVFGAQNLNVGIGAPKGTEYDVDAVAADFAALCDRAAEHDLLVAFEFMPFFAVCDATRAWDIVRTAARPNGGVGVDAYHWYRGDPDPDALRRIPGEHVHMVQLDDVPAQPDCSLMEETTTRRLLPGKGGLDLVGLISILDAAGVTAPIGLEVLSTELWAMPVEIAARDAFAATRATVDAARG